MAQMQLCHSWIICAISVGHLCRLCQYVQLRRTHPLVIFWPTPLLSADVICTLSLDRWVVCSVGRALNCWQREERGRRRICPFPKLIRGWRPSIYGRNCSVPFFLYWLFEKEACLFEASMKLYSGNVLWHGLFLLHQKKISVNSPWSRTLLSCQGMVKRYM